MAATPADDADPSSNTYLPRAARAVPYSEVVHTVQFRKITYPLADRPSELWVVETNHDGHVQWRTLERFLDTFVPTALGEPSNFALASCAHLERLSIQWRDYYDVPHPFPHCGPPQRRHLLPHPHQSNTHFDHPRTTDPYYKPVGDVQLSDIPKETQLRACTRHLLRHHRIHLLHRILLLQLSLLLRIRYKAQ